MIQETFERVFARPPNAVTSAPGRVNLIGEHTDYNGGYALPAALPQKTTVAIAASQTSVIRIVSMRHGAHATHRVCTPLPEGWAAYPIAAAETAIDYFGLSGGLDVMIESDLPDGVGLSSSASLITAILRAGANLSGAAPSPVDLARLAQTVENSRLGVPCGIMDQMAVGLCQPGEAILLLSSDLTYQCTRIPEDWQFELIDTGERRALSDGRYAERVRDCEAARVALDVETLCGTHAVPTGDAIDALPLPMRHRARHVVDDHCRAIEAKAAMEVGAFDTFATLMNDSHGSYAQLFAASTDTIDRIVHAARVAGAAGARLTGGGFGGCVVALLRTSSVDSWRHTLKAAHPEISFLSAVAPLEEVC